MKGTKDPKFSQENAPNVRTRSNHSRPQTLPTSSLLLTPDLIRNDRERSYVLNVVSSLYTERVRVYDEKTLDSSSGVVVCPSLQTTPESDSVLPKD